MSLTVWLTGLPSSGKSTIASAVADRIRPVRATEILDGDVIRREFFPELGYSKDDRVENVRRIGGMAAMLARNGVVVIVPVIAPYRSAREAVRRQHQDSGLGFVEVFVDADLDTCMSRDVKGLYRRAVDGEISGLTGYNDPYEPPEDPEVHLVTPHSSPEACTDRLAEFINQRLESRV